MSPKKQQKIVAIVGPTASGKTALGIKIAQSLKTEIISTDAVQIYRDLDIGSAKPTAEELAAAKHHFINIKNISESYNAHEFTLDARRVITQLADQNKMPLLVGGSGFFLQTLLGDRRLSDPEHPHVPQKASRENRIYQALLIGLEMPRPLLYERINQRVDLMFQQGLVAEAKKLLMQAGDFQAKKAIGYHEFENYFFADQTLDQTKDLIKRNSRHYAKRQLTFFKNQFPDIHWFDAAEATENSQIIVDFVKKFNHS